MPDFGITSPSVPRFGLSFRTQLFGAQSSPELPFGGGLAYATEDTDCYEIFVVEITKEVQQRSRFEPGGEGYQPLPSGWGVSPKMGKAEALLILKGGIYNLGGNIMKKCHCISSSFWLWTAIKAAIWDLGFPQSGCKSTSTSYKCLEITKVCKEAVGRRCGFDDCPCKDQKGISLVGITEKTEEYTASNGTKIKIKTGSTPDGLRWDGEFEEVMKQIVEAEKKIKLKCSRIIEDDHPAKKPPEER